MKNDISVITGFLTSLDTYQNLHKIELLSSESNGVYKAYKVIYIDKNKRKKRLRLELDFTHDKLSFGPWKSSSLSTKKFSSFERLKKTA